MPTIRQKKDHGELGFSSEFNVHSFSEIIVYFDEWTDTDFISNYEVCLPDGSWKCLSQAFKDKDVIPDNYNVYFKCTESEEERARGWWG